MSENDNQPQQAVAARTGQANEAPLLVWDATEFREYDRSKHWYAAVTVIGAILTIGAAILQQWLAGLVFLLATFVVIKHADDKPRLVTYAITKLGVHVDNRFHPYNELRTFWIIYNPPVRTVTLQSTSRFRPLIQIDLADVDPLTVGGTLRQYLPEESKHTEDIVEKFSRFIRL
jgi:hypothetical protein